MIPAVCNNYLQGGILLSGGFGDKIKNFPVAFPFVIIFGRSAYQPVHSVQALVFR